MSDPVVSPKHIAFVLDGNRRWAKKHKLPLLLGHKNGFDLAKSLVDAFVARNIKYVSYFVFSSENWNRSPEEISYLMNLFRDFWSGSADFFIKRNIRVKAIGNLQKLAEDIQEKIRTLEKATQNAVQEENAALTLIIAVSYSGRDEIVRAAKKMSLEFLHKIAAGEISAESAMQILNGIDENEFSTYLDTAGIPNPDILIRTSEKRISNYLLWQCAYSEIFFLDKFWPDFCEEDLDKVLDEFSKRNRRYGR